MWKDLLQFIWPKILIQEWLNMYEHDSLEQIENIRLSICSHSHFQENSNQIHCHKNFDKTYSETYFYDPYYFWLSEK